MKRRDFLRNISLATAGLTVTNLYGFSSITETASGPLLLAQRQSMLNVIADVDVLVVGASASGIAAAVSAARSGASVFLVGDTPYLGSDICGMLRLWDLEKGAQSPFQQSLLHEGSAPHPAWVKKRLQKHLMDNQIDFLLSTFAGGIIVDSENEIAGLVIVSRSGEQIIRSKVVIDATETALVARLAGKQMKKVSNRPAEYRFTVVGNKPVSTLKHRVLSPMVFKEKQYPVTEYHFTMREGVMNFADLQSLEQSIRDKTWDVDQVDSSDIMFEIPTHNFTSSSRSPLRFQDADSLPLEALQPAGTKRLYLLNGFADVAHAGKEAMLLPGNMIVLGHRAGARAGEMAKGLSVRPMAGLTDRTGRPETGSEGVVYNRVMRPRHRMDSFRVETEKIPVWGSFDNLVVGGGTAGACAAISSARYGSNTLCVEYLHGLGGMGTMGLIGRYWVGYRDGFTKEIDEGVRAMAPADHPRQRNRAADWVRVEAKYGLAPLHVALWWREKP